MSRRKSLEVGASVAIMQLSDAAHLRLTAALHF